MKIEVIQKDIDEGLPGCDYLCPVAKAINRQCDLWNTSVGSESIILNDTTYAAPLVVQSFVERFDKGEAVEPFTFVIAD